MPAFPLPIERRADAASTVVAVTATAIPTSSIQAVTQIITSVKATVTGAVGLQATALSSLPTTDSTTGRWSSVVSSLEQSTGTSGLTTGEEAGIGVGEWSILLESQ